MADYTSFGSFAPIYIEKKRALYGDRVAFFVLDEICNHANEIGVCWPGVARLSHQTRYARSTVQNALKRLFELDYIRFHMVWNPLRRVNERSLQVSPYVLYIAPDHIEDALQTWKTARFVTGSVTNDQQPESEPESEPESKPDPENHQPDSSNGEQPNAYPYPSSANGTFGSESATPNHAQKDKNKGKASANGTFGSESKNDSAAAPPMVFGSDDELVNWIASRLLTSKTQAYELVASHGATDVIAALNQLANVKKPITRPFPYLKSILENSAGRDDSPMARAVRARSNNG